uniref:Dolichyl-P-Man Man n=1 Tax=Arundo donax TaxID=35708 RepID=A0A0A9GAG6_ARUDO
MIILFDVVCVIKYIMHSLHVEALLHLGVGHHDGVERRDRSEHEVPPPPCEPPAGRGGLGSRHGRRWSVVD